MVVLKRIVEVEKVSRYLVIRPSLLPNDHTYFCHNIIIIVDVSFINRSLDQTIQRLKTQFSNLLSTSNKNQAACEFQFRKSNCQPIEAGHLASSQSPVLLLI